MPCFLKVTVGSNSVREASGLTPGPGIVHLDLDPSLSGSDERENPPPGTRGVSRVFEQVRQNPFHEVSPGAHSGPLLIDCETVSRLGMGGTQQRDPFAYQRVHVEYLGSHRGLARELRERPYAPLECVDLVDDDPDSLLHERAVGRRLSGKHLFDS